MASMILTQATIFSTVSFAFLAELLPVQALPSQLLAIVPTDGAAVVLGVDLDSAWADLDTL
jgi:hypothetical protein